MNVQLTPQEANNVYVALVSLAKSSSIDAEAMKILLVLSDKFLEKEEAPKENDKKKK